MDLKSGYPYFLIRNGLSHEYEILNSAHETDVVILGGGITGAIMAYELSTNGIQCTVLDKRSIGLGSTSASTSLLQYEIDVSLHDLISKIGKENALEAYRLCSEAIDSIYEISKNIGYEDFTYCESLYFSHTSLNNGTLKKEFDARKENGFEVNYLLQEDIIKRYGFKSKEAILSAKAAKIDAFKFTHLLHQHNLKKGAKVFENTCVEKIEENREGVRLVTDKGLVIKARKIIYATGYEVTEHISKSIVKLKSTYALATERVEDLPSFFKKTILWNTDDPYLYMREDKGRLIIGGRDENYYSPEKRAVLMERKAKKLEDDFTGLFPKLKIKLEFTWAGTFGSTKDGLPYIGIYPKKPNSYFALGFGGNGITFSVIAANMITKSIKNEINVVPKMFSFDR